MNSLATTDSRINAMSEMAIEKICQLECFTTKLPQENIDTLHIIHGGMYARTILIPAGVLLTGALVKLATILIVSGDVIVYIGEKSMELSGYNVFAASANRKQAFVAKSDTYITMIFPSESKILVDAEREFTDGAHLLMSHRSDANNKIVITGE